MKWGDKNMKESLARNHYWVMSASQMRAPNSFRRVRVGDKPPGFPPFRKGFQVHKAF